MAEIAGRWGHTPGFQIPDFLEETRDAINSVAELLVTYLDVLKGALALVRAFASAYLDPIKALLDSLLAQVKAILEDFKQLGLYITGDWNLLQFPFEDVKGGYVAYRNRMVSRLTDVRDPTRPDVSPNTTVFAAFFYLSVDFTAIDRGIAFVNQLLALLNQSQKPPNGLPVPIITTIKYGSTAGTFTENLLDLVTPIVGEPNPPTKVRVNWKVDMPATSATLNPYPAVSPGGFLVTFSTLPGGIALEYARPLGDTDKKLNANGDLEQPREYGPVRDIAERPVILQGGYQMLTNVDNVGYNQAFDGSGTLKDGYTQVYGKVSYAQQGAIPLESLYDGDSGTYYFQRTFRVEPAFVIQNWPNQTFGLTVDYAQMPHHAEVVKNADGTVTLEDQGVPAALYVRVASCSHALSDGTKTFEWDLASAEVAGNTPGEPFRIRLADGLSPTDISPWSASKTVDFPLVSARDLETAVATAIAIMVLSRVDYETLDFVGPTPPNRPGPMALTPTGLEPFRFLFDMLVPEGLTYLLEIPNRTPQASRAILLDRISKLAKKLVADSGLSPSQRSYILERTQALRKATLTQVLTGDTLGAWFTPTGGTSPTILGSLQEPFTNTVYLGVCVNPFCTEVPEPPRGIPGVFRHYAEEYVALNVPTVPLDLAPADERATPQAHQIVYDKFRNPRPFPLADGGSFPFLADREAQTYTIPDAVVAYVASVQAAKVVETSGDNAPAFYYAPPSGFTTTPTDGSGFVPCRWAFRNYESGVLFTEAAIALGSVVAAARPDQDGEWIAIRFLDAFPSIDGLVRALQQWLDSLNESTNSVVDAILQYIDFLEGRLTELQQLIRRINALIQAILSLTIGMPQSHGMYLLAEGTQGVVQGLLTSESPPIDDAADYGMGILVVAPFAPSFLVDMFLVEPGPPDPNVLMDNSGGTALVAPLPEGDVVPPDDEPDVL